jgi:protein-disulfide isomerase
MFRWTARHLASVLLSCLMLGAPTARASSFTSEQRAEIIGILREALRSDPSILREALEALRTSYRTRQDEAAHAAIALKRDSLLADPVDPVAGNPAGDVTVVEFYDTRCPYCRRMLPTLAALLKAEPGIRLVYKDLPVLGPTSQIEARALLAAQRQGGYLRMQEALMQAVAPSTPESIRVEAERQGLDGLRLLQDMNDPAIHTRLTTNMMLARGLNIGGTPAMVIGGRLIPGAMELAELRAAIQEARAR